MLYSPGERDLYDIEQNHRKFLGPITFEGSLNTTQYTYSYVYLWSAMLYGIPFLILEQFTTDGTGKTDLESFLDRAGLGDEICDSMWSEKKYIW